MRVLFLIMKRKIIFTCSFLAIGISTFLYTNNFSSAGKIHLTHHENKQYHIVTVEAEDLKYPFFGTAFHLHYNTDQLKFHHYTLGNYFTTAQSKSPIILIEDKDGRIIAGISLKRGEKITKEKGSLVHFYFEKGPDYGLETKPGKKFEADQELVSNFKPELAFSNTVFSTFDKERKDIETVKFVSI